MYQSVEGPGLTRKILISWCLHQANIRIVDAALKRLKLPQEKVCINLDRYGNTLAASVPIALHEAIVEEKIGEGILLSLLPLVQD